MSKQNDFNFDAFEMTWSCQTQNLWQFPPKKSSSFAFVQYYYSQGYRQRPANGRQKLMLQGPLEQVVTICWWYKMIQVVTICWWHKMIQDDTRWYKRIQDVTICYKMLQDVTRLFRTSQVRPFFCLVRQYRLVLKHQVRVARILSQVGVTGHWVFPWSQLKGKYK